MAHGVCTCTVGGGVDGGRIVGGDVPGAEAKSVPPLLEGSPVDVVELVVRGEATFFQALGPWPRIFAVLLDLGFQIRICVKCLCMVWRRLRQGASAARSTWIGGGDDGGAGAIVTFVEDAVVIGAAVVPTSFAGAVFAGCCCPKACCSCARKRSSFDCFFFCLRRPAAVPRFVLRVVPDVEPVIFVI